MRLLTRSLLPLIALSCGLPALRAQIFTVGNGTQNVGEFNASTGAAINKDVLVNSAYSSPPNQLQNPDGIAVSGSYLYVTTEPSQGNGTVTRYNWNGTTATNGTVVVSGLNSPAGLSLSGSTLFVVDNLNGDVAAYNMSSGSAVNLYLVSANYPSSVVVSGSTLFVGSMYTSQGTGSYTGSINAYNVSTGAFLGTVASGLDFVSGLAVSGNTLYASTYFNDSVASFTISGSTLTHENASFVTGLNTPDAIAIDGSMLLIGDNNDTPYNDNASIVAVNAATGALINSAFVPQYSGIDYITQIDVLAVPEPSWSAFGAAVAALAGACLWRRRVNAAACA